MSIKTEIDRIKANVSDAFTAVDGKGGTVPASRTSAGLAGAIESIPLGTDTSDATAAAGDILSGKTAYVKGSRVTGTVAARTQAVPEITFNEATGKITASAVQEAGYVAAGTKSASKKLAIRAERTVTPTTKDIVYSAGVWLTGKQTIKGDANLVAENIRSGVSIFGVEGTLEAEDSSAAVLYEVTIYNRTATAFNAYFLNPKNALATRAVAAGGSASVVTNEAFALVPTPAAAAASIKANVPDVSCLVFPGITSATKTTILGALIRPEDPASTPAFVITISASTESGGSATS